MKQLLLVLFAFTSLQMVNATKDVDQNCIAFLDAARANDLRRAKELLNSATRNCQNLQGYTALHYAVLNNNSELLKLLIKNNASALIINGLGQTPAALAHVLKQTQNAKMLKRLEKRQHKELYKKGYAVL